jgi:hypothetical protein
MDLVEQLHKIHTESKSHGALLVKDKAQRMNQSKNTNTQDFT